MPTKDDLLVEIDRLRMLVDALWGVLPADVVLELDDDTVAACRSNHEVVWHS